MDSLVVAQTFIDDNMPKEKVELLEVRKRNFMIRKLQQRKNQTQSQWSSGERHCTICEENNKPIEMIKSHNAIHCFDNPVNPNRRNARNKN